VSVWLPVLFVCLTNNACEFYSGTLSVSVAQCESQNAEVKQALALRSNVSAYQIACIKIKPKTTDSL
jgi:hypothetical protein